MSLSLDVRRKLKNVINKLEKGFAKSTLRGHFLDQMHIGRYRGHHTSPGVKLTSPGVRKSSGESKKIKKISKKFFIWPHASHADVKWPKLSKSENLRFSKNVGNRVQIRLVRKWRDENFFRIFFNFYRLLRAIAGTRAT